MRSPAWAIAWELWRPHRAVLGWLLVAMVVLAVVFALLPPGTMSPEEAAGCTVLSVGWTLLVYALLTFTYSLPQTDMASARSTFPARLFTLPVRTSALVAWPMLYGTVFIALTWVVFAALVRALMGNVLSLWSPALGMAAFLAWWQVVAWCPFRLPWLRVVAAIFLLVGFAAIPNLVLGNAVPEWAIATAFACLIPAAYGVALTGVSRARRGDDSESRPTHVEAPSAARQALRGRLFPSAARAQVWYEWRQHWCNLPLVLVILLGWFAAGLWFAKHYEAVFRELERTEGMPPQLRIQFVSLILLVLFLAAVMGIDLGNTGSKGSGLKAFTVTAFQGVRPMSAAAMVAAKLEAAAWITLLCWGLLGIGVPLALLGTGTTEGAVGWLRDWLAEQPPLQAGGFVLVAAVVCIGGTWANMASSMFLGLAGRAWIIPTLTLVLLLCFPALGLLREIPRHPEYHAALASGLPWVLGGAVGLKAIAAGWVVGRVHRAGLLTGRALLRALGVWALVTGGLFTLLYVLLPAGEVPWYLLAFGVILFVPIGRLLAAPLALAWNRHR
jgi:hypothetical protein